jgi:hypothetical protein
MELVREWISYPHTNTGGGVMKKVMAVLFAVLLAGVSMSPAWAGGDEVRGDNGQGDTNQVDADSQGNQAP